MPEVRSEEKAESGKAKTGQSGSNNPAEYSNRPLGLVTDGDPPGYQETEQPIPQMIGCRDNAEDVETEHQGILQALLHQRKTGMVTGQQPADTGGIDMIKDKTDSHNTGNPLQEVHPIAKETVGRTIRLPGVDNIESIHAMKEDRYPDKANLDQQDIRQSHEELYLGVIDLGAEHGKAVGEKMFSKEGTDRKHAGKGVEPAKKKGIHALSSQVMNSPLDIR